MHVLLEPVKHHRLGSCRFPVQRSKIWELSSMIERALQRRTLSIRTTATRHSDVTVGIVTVASCTVRARVRAIPRDPYDLILRACTQRYATRTVAYPALPLKTKSGVCVESRTVGIGGA